MHYSVCVCACMEFCVEFLDKDSGGIVNHGADVPPQALVTSKKSSFVV